jgi:hypothetical protein
MHAAAGWRHASTSGNAETRIDELSPDASIARHIKNVFDDCCPGGADIWVLNWLNGQPIQHAEVSTNDHGTTVACPTLRTYVASRRPRTAAGNEQAGKEHP